jgi:hypothetical protein
MANQIQATVYQIDGSPLNNSIQIAFLTSNVYMREFQTDLIPAVNSAIVYYPNTSNQLQEQTFLVSETITALVSSANSGGTSQISTTVLEINQEPQIPSGLTFSFPVQGISIWPVANPVVDGVNSYLEFKNKKYYLLEDESALVTAANTNPIGTIPTLDQVLTASNNNTVNAEINFTSTPTTYGLMGRVAMQLSQDNGGLPIAFTASAGYLYFASSINANYDSYSYLYKNPNDGPVNSFNYLPGTSGTLLNGNFVNGEGLSLDYANNLFTLGDISSAFIKADIPNNKIEFNASNITFSNVATSSTGAAVVPQEFLNIVVNGQNRKLQLLA